MRKRQRKKLLRGTRRQRRKAYKQHLAAVAHYLATYRSPPCDIVEAQLPPEWIAFFLYGEP